jgi:glycine/D-amino acid oxidase-like deaminating enzyme/nitrite reductase/ring-hydroxylating ferredoxin subunit
MEESSPWKFPSGRAFPALVSTIEVDVAVIGGGIAGVTTAYELTKAGLKVALIEQASLGDGATGSTTAFVTYISDASLADLTRTFGAARAALVWKSGSDAVDEMERIIKEESIDCDFARCAGYIYAPDKEGLERLRREEKLAKDYGFPARLGQDQLGFASLGSLRVERQAKFHPMKFLTALADRAAAKGARIFENSRVIGTSSGPVRIVKTTEGEVRAKHVVLATHVPLGDPELISLRIDAYQTYVLEAEIPNGILEEGIYQDTLKPYHYFRVDRAAGFDRLLVGGEDHRTGQSDDCDAHFARLETFARDLLPGKELKIVRKWSGEVLETIDGLPYIGSFGRNLFAATGFSGTGMSFGMLSAMIIRDLILGKKNAVTDLYQARRLTGMGRMLGRVTNFVAGFSKGRLEQRSSVLDDLLPDEGKVVTIHGKKVAAYRKPDGKIVKLSPVCTHMGCMVKWNSAGKSWDCPCHGSRFKKEGEVLNGPARTPLEKLK